MAFAAPAPVSPAPVLRGAFVGAESVPLRSASVPIWDRPPPGIMRAMLRVAAAIYLASQPAPGQGGAAVLLAGQARAQFSVGIAILPRGGQLVPAPQRSAPAPAVRSGDLRRSAPRYGESTLDIGYE